VPKGEAILPNADAQGSGPPELKGAGRCIPNLGPVPVGVTAPDPGALIVLMFNPFIPPNAPVLWPINDPPGENVPEAWFECPKFNALWLNCGLLAGLAIGLTAELNPADPYPAAPRTELAPTACPPIDCPLIARVDLGLPEPMIPIPIPAPSPAAGDCGRPRGVLARYEGALDGVNGRKG
jgi:hypothetical protein